MSPRPPIHRALLHALLLAAVALGPVAMTRQVQAAEPVQAPASSLEEALNAFARHSGITLSFDPELVRGRLAVPLSGEHTAAEGLALLLAPHRLEAVRGSGGAYVVQASAPARASGDGAPLPPITATAAAEQADGPVDGYAARRSSITTRGDEAVVGIPHSVTVVTRAQMDDQAVQTVDQSLRYSAGVLTEATGHDVPLSSLTVRGMAPSGFLDGIKLFSTNSYTTWPTDPQGLERVELLRGAGAALYDQAVPGGLIHMISKRPTADAVREVAVSVGNHDRYQSSFDIGGALNEDRTLLFRLNGLARKSGTQTDFGRDDRTFIAPALTWQPSARTSVTLLADATRDRMTPKSAWPQYTLLLPNPNGPIPRERFIGEPGISRYDRKSSSLTYLLTHQFDDGWTFRQSARYAALDLEYVQIAGTAFRADMRTLDRALVLWRNDIRQLSFDNQLEGRFDTGAFAHTMRLGLDYQLYSSEGGLAIGPIRAIDVFAPAYTNPAGPNTGIAAQRIPPTHDTLRQLGIYVQDQIRSGPWSLSLAIRRDTVRGKSHTDFTSFTDFASMQPLPPGEPQNDKTTYAVGMSYLFANGLAPYLSYSTSFVPTVSANFYRSPAVPELGRQFEAGLKYRPPDVDMLLTLSAYELHKRNLAINDPNWPQFQMQIGALRTRGIEFEARGALTRRLQLIGSFSALDARITSAEDPAGFGKRPPQTPRNTAALWLDYRLGGGALQGWSVSGGVRHVGKVPADLANNLFNPSYTLVDAAVRYERGPYAAALNATNLFDRRYVSGLGQFFGQGRALQLKFAYRW